MTARGIAQQFGLAMMPSFWGMSSGLTSGTTRGTFSPLEVGTASVYFHPAELGTGVERRHPLLLKLMNGQRENGVHIAELHNISEAPYPLRGHDSLWTHPWPDHQVSDRAEDERDQSEDQQEQSHGCLSPMHLGREDDRTQTPERRRDATDEQPGEGPEDDPQRAPAGPGQRQPSSGPARHRRSEQNDGHQSDACEQEREYVQGAGPFRGGHKAETAPHLRRPSGHRADRWEVPPLELSRPHANPIGLGLVQSARAGGAHQAGHRSPSNSSNARKKRGSEVTLRIASSTPGT